MFERKNLIMSEEHDKIIRMLEELKHTICKIHKAVKAICDCCSCKTECKSEKKCEGSSCKTECESSCKKKCEGSSCETGKTCST